MDDDHVYEPNNWGSNKSVSDDNLDHCWSDAYVNLVCTGQGRVLID